MAISVNTSQAARGSASDNVCGSLRGQPPRRHTEIANYERRRSSDNKSTMIQLPIDSSHHDSPVNGVKSQDRSSTLPHPDFVAHSFNCLSQTMPLRHKCITIVLNPYPFSRTRWRFLYSFLSSPSFLLSPCASSSCCCLYLTLFLSLSLSLWTYVSLQPAAAASAAALSVCVSPSYNRSASRDSGNLLWVDK